VKGGEGVSEENNAGREAGGNIFYTSASECRK
jgi:hypothetical protein